MLQCLEKAIVVAEEVGLTFGVFPKVGEIPRIKAILKELISRDEGLPSTIVSFK